MADHSGALQAWLKILADIYKAGQIFTNNRVIQRSNDIVIWGRKHPSLATEPGSSGCF